MWIDNRINRIPKDIVHPYLYIPRGHNLPQGLYSKTIVVWSVVHKSNVCCVLYMFVGLVYSHISAKRIKRIMCGKKSFLVLGECDILYFINVFPLYTYLVQYTLEDVYPYVRIFHYKFGKVYEYKIKERNTVWHMYKLILNTCSRK